MGGQHEEPLFGPKADESAKARGDEVGSIADELAVVGDSFTWYARSAARLLEGLRRDLAAVDKPTWNAKLAYGVLDTAIELGALASGEYLASKAIGAVANKVGGTDAASKMQKGLGHDLLKELFKSGATKGIAAGRSAMQSSGSSPDRFIDGHLEAIDIATDDNQRHFRRVTRHQVKTSEEAATLVSACSHEAMHEAATQQVQAVRNGWLSYLAQSTYGSVEQANGHVTTNMTNEAERERTNEAAMRANPPTLEQLIAGRQPPGSVPSTGPGMGEALFGNSPGVLSVLAHVPAIDADDRVNGEPTVELAYLGGVNDAIRSKYENKLLADATIPRHIDARVNGAGFVQGTPRFNVNADERGVGMGFSDGRWLRRYYEATHPGTKASPEEKLRGGLAHLLANLLVTTIKRPVE